MTNSECEIVANAGAQLREIAERLTIPPSAVLRDAVAIEFVRIMDAAALAVSEVYGALSALPLEAENGDRWYYICDHCGSIVTITDAPIPEDESWECADCGSSTMWEFTNETNAMQHAEHIRRLVASGLVRRS